MGRDIKDKITKNLPSMKHLRCNKLRALIFLTYLLIGSQEGKGHNICRSLQGFICVLGEMQILRMWSLFVGA
jgi:hypothetical protein